MSAPLPPEPGLDLVLLSGARRALWDAELATITGKPNSALLRARDALERLTLVLSEHARRELVERLVSDAEPRLSAERDTRPVCQNCDKPAIDDEERCADCDHEHRAELDFQHRMEAP